MYTGLSPKLRWASWDSMVWLATGTIPASRVITRTPANITMSSPIIQLSVIRALRHSTGLNDGQVADRDGVEPAACGVHQPRDHQGGDRRDEGVRRYGEHSPRLAYPSQVPGQQDHDHANADPYGRWLHRRVRRGDGRHAGGDRDCDGHDVVD